MAFVPFGEWLPDQPDFNNPGAATIQNVVPRTATSYGPIGTPVAYSGALTARCQGNYSMRDAAGNVYNFAGDANRLYLLKAGSTNFSDVSKTTSAPYAVPVVPDGFWSFTSFGTRAIATDFIDSVQTFLAGTDTKFSDLAAAAPKARYCAVIRDFLFLGNTTDGTFGAQPQRLWWSAIGDPTSWPTPGTNAAISVQSDFQDLEQTDLGQITGIIGGLLSATDGVAFCERGLYRIAYAGSPAIFDFSVLQGAAGTAAPLSLVERRLATPNGIVATAYYLGEEGFYTTDGATCTPIGAEKMDKTFFSDVDASYVGYTIGTADPINKLIFFAYMAAGSGGLFNRLLVYNWNVNRWTLCDLTATPAEWLSRSLSIGYTLDGLDAVSTSVDALPYSLDSRFWTGGVPALSVFDSTHHLAYLTGSNMAPTVETSEGQLFPGRRAKIISARPICDGAGGSVAVGHRELLSDSVTYETAIPANIIGECPQRSTGRYHRFRLTLPAATSFTHLQGLDVQARPEGAKR